jgi:hypothetical protein
LSEGEAARNDEQILAKLYEEYPDAAFAHRIHYSPCPEAQHILQARILTSETFEQIAERMSVDAAAIKLYADLFFDVRDRMNAKVWIMRAVFGNSATRSKFNKDGSLTATQRGAVYRWFGYAGGPLALDAIVTGLGGLAEPKGEKAVFANLDNTLPEIVHAAAVAAALLYAPIDRNALRFIKLALAMDRKGRSRKR